MVNNNNITMTRSPKFSIRNWQNTFMLLRNHILRITNMSRNSS